MPEAAPFRRLTFRIVLLKVSPLVARLVSVPDDLLLEELHEVLQLTLGWRCEPFYSFCIHGQEISRRRHLQSRLLREFQPPAPREVSVGPTKGTLRWGAISAAIPTRDWTSRQAASKNEG
jgi:hypothetical protein